MYHRLVLVAVAVLLSFLLLQSPPRPVPTRLRAARLRWRPLTGDFETFHDLAWRAAQKGRPNDPELMYLLARAQSLSGRPGDALVMLRRLAQMGVVTDADDDDFERVRDLAGWPELEALMALPRVAGRTALQVRGPPGASPGSRPPRARPDRRRTPAAPIETKARRGPRRGRRGPESAMRLNTTTMNPVGLAYDSASRRFVVGDGDGNKLMVADEVFDHVNDLIGAASAGFGRLSAVEIDTRRGDLWVTSSDGNGAASIHKLQLVSGRVLSQLAVPSALQPIAISDFAVIESGGLLLLDSREDGCARHEFAGPSNGGDLLTAVRCCQPRGSGGEGHTLRTRAVCPSSSCSGGTCGRGRCNRRGVARRSGGASAGDKGNAARAPGDRLYYAHGQKPPVALVTSPLTRDRTA